MPSAVPGAVADGKQGCQLRQRRRSQEAWWCAALPESRALLRRRKDYNASAKALDRESPARDARP
jgi:hypothetical protein